MKPSASTIICNIIGYFCEIDLNFFIEVAIIVVAKHYTRNNFQWYPHICLNMIFDCCGTNKGKSAVNLAEQIQLKAYQASGKSKVPLSPLKQFNKTYV